MKHKRTKATSISKEVRHEVYERDGHKCILCGRWVDESHACCHIIRRSQGGLGIPQNIVTLCDDCHREMDGYGDNRRLLREAQAYIEAEYGYIDPQDLVYDKYRDCQWGVRE